MRLLVLFFITAFVTLTVFFKFESFRCSFLWRRQRLRLRETRPTPNLDKRLKADRRQLNHLLKSLKRRRQ